jgi:hypothetical protein
MSTTKEIFLTAEMADYVRQMYGTHFDEIKGCHMKALLKTLKIRSFPKKEDNMNLLNAIGAMINAGRFDKA